MSNIYPLTLAGGILASFLWIGLSVPPTKSTTLEYNQRGIDAALWATLTGLTGARLGYVLLHIDYFRTNPNQITWFWEGGLSWIGGVVGAFLGVATFTLLYKHRFWALADTFAIPISILGFVSWLGCYFDSCAYGRRAELGFLTPPSNDIFGVVANRWPVQGAGVIISLLIFLLLINLQRRKMEDGTLFLVSLGAISVTNLLLYIFRGDPIRLINGLRLDALATAALILIEVVAITILMVKSFLKKKSDEA